MRLSPPCGMLGAEKNLFSVPHWPATVLRCPTAVIADKIKQTFSKESKLPFLPPIMPPALMQPVCTAVSTLATRAQAWKAIPGVSGWVMNTVRRGYSLQFARKPPRFRGVLASSVRSDDAHVLSAVVMNLLEKGAIEIFPPSQSEYSHYFLVPKKDSGLRPILDLRLLKSHPDEKIVQYDHFETDPLANMPRGLVCVAGSERRLFSHPDSPHHRLFLRVAFEGVAYQYQVLPFGLSLATRTFTRCMDAAGNPHTPLPRRLAHFGPVAGSFDIAQNLLLSHLDCLGLRVNFAKSVLSPSQRVSFLGTVIDSVQLTATVSAERVTSIQRHMTSFKEGNAHPLKAFQKMLGLMAAASPVLRLGLLRMQPIQFWLKQRVPAAAWHHGHHRVMVTRACVSALNRLRNLLWLKRGGTLNTAHRRKVVTTDASNKGWGALCEDKTTFGLWSEEESTPHINCLEMLGVCQACQFFLPDIQGHHVLVRSDSRSMVSSINHQGGLVSK